MSIATLRRPYLASLEMAESDPDMPSHASVEIEFEAAMEQARKELADAGVTVPTFEPF